MSGRERRGDLARLPHERGLPGPLTLVVRWRVELAAGAWLGLFWHSAGSAVVGLLALFTVLSALVTPSLRRAWLYAWQFTVVPHRVRVALAQAGIGDRYGRLPWVLWAVPSSAGYVRVEIATLAGTRVESVEAAASMIAESCGAAAVRAYARPDRPDRIVLIVDEPYWGLP